MRQLVLFLLLTLAVGAEPKPQLACSPPDYPLLTFSHDNSHLLLVGGDHYWVWSVTAQRLVSQSKVSGLVDAALSADGKYLALGSRPRSLLVRDLKSQKVRLEHRGPEVESGKDPGAYGCTFSPDGHYLVAWGMRSMTESSDPQGYLFDWPSGKKLRTFAVQPQGTSCGWTPSGKMFILDDQQFVLCDTLSGAVEQTTVMSQVDRAEFNKQLEGLGLRTQASDPHGRIQFLQVALAYQIVSSQGGQTRFFTQDKPLGSLEWVGSLALSPNGHVLAALTKKGVLLIDVDASLKKCSLVPVAAK